MSLMRTNSTSLTHAETSTPMQEQPQAPSFFELSELQKRAEIKNIVEALLFSADHPLDLKRIHDVINPSFPYSLEALRELIKDLKSKYQESHAFQLHEVAGGYILKTSERYRFYLEKLHGTKRTEKLSQAALEVVSIILYRTPITRIQIEAIRGVDSSGLLHSLLERKFIEQVGTLEAPGRPSLYGPTSSLLSYLGIKSLTELPPLENTSSQG